MSRLLELIRERPFRALLVAVTVTVVGRLVDLQWHLTHDEFEGASEQVRAHLLLWIGVGLILLVCVTAVRAGVEGRGYRVALVGSALYAPVSTWHFIEHANGSDPELAHILIGAAYAVMLVGLALVIAAEPRRRRDGNPA